jgi:mevalonate kinase
LTFNTYYNAKLLLTAEYLVLNGAKALAVPLKFGQKLQVTDNNQRFISWKSISYDASEWFSGKFELSDFSILESSNPETAVYPQRLLMAARKFNPGFLSDSSGNHVISTLNYPLLWGLGSSSTLIAAVAGWAGVDPFKLHFAVSSGSGYDIACAISNGPIVYKISDGTPEFETVQFKPSFADKIYFVYQGNKQDSAEGIQSFRKRNSNPDPGTVKKADLLTERMLHSVTLSEFEQLISEHELLISNLLDILPVSQTLFIDLPGEAKSLGAWGGDFCMITWRDDPSLLPAYLKSKGLETWFNFHDIVL